MRAPSLPVVIVLFLTACAHAPDAPAPATAPPAASPPSAPAPEASPPPAPPASATEYLAAHRAPFDACYARARQARPELRRTSVEITFTLDDAGKPSTVSLEYKHRWDDAAKDCMRAAAMNVEMPATLRGKQVGTIAFEPK